MMKMGMLLRKGAALAEYAVILAVVLVGAVVALSLIGNNASNVFYAASDELIATGN